VRDSDATVLFSIKPALTGGSLKTLDFARKHNKPRLHLCAGDKAAADKLKAFTEERRVKILNVAGPRASEEAGGGGVRVRMLAEALGKLAPSDTSAQHFRPRPRMRRLTH
jgi:Circularly permutated YpsA SLOG family